MKHIRVVWFAAFGKVAKGKDGNRGGLKLFAHQRAARFTENRL